MQRQHATPLLVSPDGGTVVSAVPLEAGAHGWNESAIQDFVHRHPHCLPIAEIDPLFVNPVSVCKELATTAGPVDNLLITASGLPVLVECKLWRNPQGRREVVGQILDYAKELSRWSVSDLEREARKRLGRSDSVLLNLLRSAGSEVDEITFNDAVTQNLRRGRFLLLIVGDGIREGVEAIATYLQAHAGLHFTFGLVEMAIYAAPDGSRIVVPRVVARTRTIERTVIAVPDGYVVRDGDDEDGDEPPLPAEQLAGREQRRTVRLQFWREFLAGLQLDDPEQMLPSPNASGNLRFNFGQPGESSWLSTYRYKVKNHVGLFLAWNTNSPGERAAQALAEQADAIRQELGPGAVVQFSDRPAISQFHAVDDLDSPTGREEAVAWLRERTNVFVNALRPRLRTALRNLAEEQ